MYPLSASYDEIGGFLIVKKLFELHPSVILDEFSTLRITGPYEMLKIDATTVSFQAGDYMIFITGEEVTVDSLTEQNARVSINELEALTIRYQPDGETLHEY